MDLYKPTINPNAADEHLGGTITEQIVTPIREHEEGFHVVLVTRTQKDGAYRKELWAYNENGHCGVSLNWNDIVDFVENMKNAEITKEKTQTFREYVEKLADKHTITVRRGDEDECYYGWASGTFVIGDGDTEEECIKNTREELIAVIIYSMKQEYDPITLKELKTAYPDFPG